MKPRTYQSLSQNFFFSNISRPLLEYFDSLLEIFRIDSKYIVFLETLQYLLNQEMALIFSCHLFLPIGRILNNKYRRRYSMKDHFTVLIPQSIYFTVKLLECVDFTVDSKIPSSDSLLISHSIISFHPRFSHSILGSRIPSYSSDFTFISFSLWKKDFISHRSSEWSSLHTSSDNTNNFKQKLNLDSTIISAQCR